MRRVVQLLAAGLIAAAGCVTPHDDIDTAPDAGPDDSPLHAEPMHGHVEGRLETMVVDLAAPGTEDTATRIRRHLKQRAYLKAPNTDASDHFGWSVAMSDDLLVVGAYGEASNARGVNGNQNNDSAPSSGAVYIFRRDRSRWALEAYLKASNSQVNDGFGYHVAVSGDTVAVGAPWEDSRATGINGNQNDNGALESGAVYVFRHLDGVWAQEAYIKASNTGAQDFFGQPVALWGDTLVVGAHLEDGSSRGVNGPQNDTGFQAGAAYVFRRTGSTWTQEAYLKPSNTDRGDQFGLSVAVWGDTIAVGAYAEDSTGAGDGGANDNNRAPDSGAVYVYRKGMSGWAQEAYLKASNAQGYDNFGWSLALWGDTLLVGAPKEDSAATGVDGDQTANSATDSGAAYVFRRTGPTWQQTAYLKASNTQREDWFGRTVALRGTTAVVGAWHEDGSATRVNGNELDDSAPESGAAYVYQDGRRGWEQTAYLKASNTQTWDYLSYGLAVGPDSVVASAPYEDSSATGMNGNEDDDSTSDSGAVYMFR